MKATKKPIEIDYFPCDIRYVDEIVKWSTNNRPVVPFTTTGTDGVTTLSFCITTLEGEMMVTEKDVIIKGINGEIYPCKKDIFEATYSF